MDVLELHHTFERARVGASIVYHVGNVASERHPDVPNSRDVDLVATKALNLSDMGVARLTQRRVGPGVCEYIIQKTPPRRQTMYVGPEYQGAEFRGAAA